MTIHKNIFPKAVALQLNYHKTLPCTNVSAQDSHYLRKLRTNLFGIYCANEETIHCFLYDLLDKMKTKHGRFDQLTILCDNSQGQFKECFLFFFTLITWWKRYSIWEEFSIFFQKDIRTWYPTGNLAVYRSFLTQWRGFSYHKNGQYCWRTVLQKKYQGTLGNFKHDQGL